MSESTPALPAAPTPRTPASRARNRTRPRAGSVALAIALQPQRAGHPWHAAVITAEGQAHEFESLIELVRFLASLSEANLPPATGLK